MTIHGRFIHHDPGDAYFNMAADLALWKTLADGSKIPTLRIYSWDKPSVTAGWFQNIHKSTDVAYCSGKNIPVIRRVSGGGTVFHDKEITYSLCIPIGYNSIPSSIDGSFRFLLQPLCSALNATGIPARLNSINDIAVGGKKISGNAQYRSKGVLLMHGTIILSIDKDLMCGSLKNKTDGKCNIYKIITSVAEVLHEKEIASIRINLEEKILLYFGSILGLSFESSVMNSNENAAAGILQNTLFIKNEWNSDIMTHNKRKKTLEQALDAAGTTLL